MESERLSTKQEAAGSSPAGVASRPRSSSGERRSCKSEATGSIPVSGSFLSESGEAGITPVFQTGIASSKLVSRIFGRIA